MNLFLRMLSVTFLLPLVVWLLILGYVYICLFVYIIILICLYEFGLIVLNRNKIVSLFFSVFGVLYIFFSAFSIIPIELLLVFICFFIGIVFIFNPNWSSNNIEKATILLFGLLYIGHGLYSIVYLYEFNYNVNFKGFDFVCLILIITWSNDTFAYFIGKFLGKHKIYEKISNKKTWEGFIAGSIASIVMPFIFYFIFSLFNINILDSLKFYDIISVGLFSSIIAPLGDFVESRLKRAYKIKDSSSILPGHGGLLDRVDALLIVAPSTYLYLILFKI